jgi:PAS domain S-box-containing protein
MSIRSSLKRMTWLSLVFVLAMALLFAFAMVHTARAQSRCDLAMQMNNVQSERQLALDDFILRREDRALGQWNSRTEAFRALLERAEASFSGPAAKLALMAAEPSFNLTVEDFTSLNKIFSRRESPPTAVEREGESLLISQLFLSAYSLRSSVSALQGIALSDLIAARVREENATIALALLVAAVLAYNSFLLNRIVANRIARLLAGINSIGGGDLDYRIAMAGDDELSSIASAIGTMALRISQSHASIAQLNEEIERRSATEEQLRLDQERLGAILDTAMDGFWLVSSDSRILVVNQTYCRMSGWSADELVGRHIVDLEATESPDEVADHMRLIVETGYDRFETRHRRKDGSIFDIESSVQYRPEQRQLVVFLRDVSERKREDRFRAMTIELLATINAAPGRVELIHAIVGKIRAWLGCDAVGVRYQEGEDYPYFETSGFPDDFVEMERRLCNYGPDGKIVRDGQGNPVLDCMCGNVLRGRFDPTKPFFTPKGSFWSNNTTRLLASTTEADRQSRTRNRCNGEGYQSVGLFPMRYNHRVLGLIQVNAFREGLFEPRLIEILEGLADNMAIALSQTLASEEIQRRLEEKEALLHELFHRTRNNMQVIIGILDAESRLLGNELVDETVRRSNGRIMAMALIQQQLYEMGDLTHVNLALYCGDLVHLLESESPEGPEGVRFWVQAEPVTVSIDTAIPFGLAAYELASNASRHAYADRRGEIRLTLSRSPGAEIEFTVSDDGVGLPEGFDARKAAGLGFQLVYGLVEDQLGGKLSLETSHGLSCRVSFPEEKVVKRPEALNSGSGSSSGRP